MGTFSEYSEAEQRFLSFVSYPGRHLWIGEFPIVDADKINIKKCTNYRTSGCNYTKYSVIWIIEDYLSDIKEWRIVLDELIRLLEKDGLIVCRYKKSAKYFSNIALKNFLARRFLCDVDLVLEQDNLDIGITTSVFKIKRKNLEIYKDKSWTFGIITSGNKVDNVVKFCQSVRDQIGGSEHEIIIVGPKEKEYGKFNVKHLEVIVDESKGEICKKKNAIIKASNGSNIVIAHDRYYLANNFVESFDIYGYDFDYLTVPQFYEDGNVFPALNGFNSDKLYWSSVYYTENFNIYPDNVFVNGGFIVLKKNTAQKLPFNDLLYWNQAEDVELAKYYLNNSLVPRVNSITAAYTLGITSEYTSTILSIEKDCITNSSLKNKYTVNDPSIFVLLRIIITSILHRFSISKNKTQTRIKKVDVSYMCITV